MDALHTLMHIVRDNELTDDEKHEILMKLYRENEAREDKETLQYIKDSIKELNKKDT